MLLCDRCNKGWHIHCLSPPLKQVPPGNWYCLECLNSDKDSFGFVPGKKFSLESFRRLADRAKRKWFGSAPASRVQLEKKFWEIVEGSTGEVEVMYGSDLDTSVYGSGFPRINDQKPVSIDVEKWNEYCGSPWNLNNLPKLRGSMLQAVHHNIAGVMVPWLYIGMLFSSFCWHFEDHCFYSMNYLHWGEPKCWYSVPGNEASAFETVMRNSLPDLFDAQPDLLFQLVTMLNPSVLVENGVPVYSVLQEPGSFVITFPRSYHGGFNFGLNCAEAVNFAPADWLPHGGSGAELYRLYHKAAVLSHDELLCVVVKSDFDSKASPYIKKELQRIYDKEKSCRETLWKNGIVNSSLMKPRNHPEYVGTEEDPTCIICQQYLYLSAVVCRCRPSAFVCLEHWEHLCECKPNKHRLLYRHTLTDLKDLVIMTDKHISGETEQVRNLRRQTLSFDGMGALTKKVKGGHVTLGQLAKKWFLSSRKILQIPYSRESYLKALKEAEQFLWAGSEMDPVREMTKNLVKGQKWAEDVRDCLSKVEKLSCDHRHDTEKVKLEHVTNLLTFDPAPCNEPAILKLKDYEVEARVLCREINSALSTSSSVSTADLEILYTRVCDSPIYISESEKLSERLSSAKVWRESVRKCISEKLPAAIETNMLYKLQSEISELPVQLPEVKMLLGLIRQVESCVARCNEMLKGPINLKKLEAFLQEYSDFIVNIPQLKLLGQYHSDAISWISHFNDVLINIHEREDQVNVVNELTCIQRDGALLKIQVDELSHVEIELKKAHCRVKALKALGSRMPLEFIREVIMESNILQIEKERLFGNISRIRTAAVNWEERALYILASKAQKSDFEDAIRASEDICALLPSLGVVKEALSLANLWLEKAEPFLVSNISVRAASNSLLKFEDLKELVSQSKLLKISLRQLPMLQRVLDNCIKWENDARSSLYAVEHFLRNDNIDDGITSGLVSKIEQQVTAMESIIKAGLSLGLDFGEIPKLQDACSTLNWCLKTLSFCSAVPLLEEVEMLMEVASNVPVTYASSSLFGLLIDGVHWLKEAAEISLPCRTRNFKLSDAEYVLGQSKEIKVSFPSMVSQLANVIKKHNLWREQVHQFLSLEPGNRTWSLLLELKIWFLLKSKRLRNGSNAVRTLLIKGTLDRSLSICGASKGQKATELSVCCSNNFDNQDILACSVCKDCYHLQCHGPSLADRKVATSFICHYCHFVGSGRLSQNGVDKLRFGRTRTELSKLVELLTDADNLSIWIEEINVLKQLVEKAIEWKACLTEVLDSALACHGEDLFIAAGKLSTAMKVVELAGIYDYQVNCKFDLALARNSWRVRANKLLGGLKRPTIQHIQQHLKEGLTISIPSEDHFWQKLTGVKHNCIQWIEKAKEVSTDCGALGLDKVFELIAEGKNLPVNVERELKLLRDRSMLYCICRKPDDQKPMIACDKCDEWYHFACIKLTSAPKIFICPACNLHPEDLYSLPMTQDRLIGSRCEEPQTPSPRHRELRFKSQKPNSRTKLKLPVAGDDGSDEVRHYRGTEFLFWRNRKRFRRAARKRSQLDSLSPFIHIQDHE
ncbi:lysine-specific demethylase JMJ17 isoform X2 [Diospyros lotus]|uniref:lysine-specific demethylase JMJ17 isoform X2 n=1 Tax=Diospyros lotus TaxID=55363 RepID=UPI00224F103E|nr:lysine-specific demethylase JMJ17 isoform X2 [Diospyros lotus]